MGRRVIERLGYINRSFDHDWRLGLLLLAEPGFLGFLIEALVFQFAGLFFGSFYPLLGCMMSSSEGAQHLHFSAFTPVGGGVDD